ncbi:MAG TPA: leucyl aminopeptidase family protein [Steroidobacteraceae bacterium]|nr:leucyl aminopeptidase family protein [Steroidobacteraceae bacterium]
MPAASDLLLRVAAPNAVPLWLVAEGAVEEWLAGQPAATAQWTHAAGFKGERHRFLLLPASDGSPAGAVLGLGKLTSPDDLSLWHSAGLADKLPAGTDFRCATPLAAAAATQIALGFLYGHYRFDRYRRAASQSRPARLILPAGGDAVYAERSARALALGRDLINTPAGDMGPAELAGAASALAQRLEARCRVIEGEALLEQSYPLIHAVGRASARAPRLIDLTWGDASRPLVTLVGKGVCFDSGGLDLKPAVSMALMKKDMGGAACALALAQMIIEARLSLRLRVLIPAVENSVSGDAYRPGDVLLSRKGLTVEIGNTDAEGRLVLADALAEGDAARPALLIDLATLTGAARIALGAELPAVYGNDEELVQSLVRHGRVQHDPLWPMPLWAPYDEELVSKVADVANVAPSALAGSVFGALFLRRFVAEHTPWLHIDLFAWNPRERPGRPVGAEAQCVRALYALLAERFAAAA